MVRVVLLLLVSMVRSLVEGIGTRSFTINWPFALVLIALIAGIMAMLTLEAQLVSQSATLPDTP